MFGPTGAGLLYGKTEWLEKMPPFLGGGEMIDRVTFEESTFEDPPHRFEAGTPAIGEVIGLGAALKYIDEVGIDRIHDWEQELLAYCTEQLGQFEEVKIMGQAPEKSGVVAFTMEGAHPFDIGTLLDHEGVAIRVGHHCAQPVMDHYGVAATARVSFGLYNNREDIDRFIEGMKTVRDMLLT
jgi:cysteine desulfurase/selenocysteine lyase